MQLLYNTSSKNEIMYYKLRHALSCAIIISNYVVLHMTKKKYKIMHSYIYSLFLLSNISIGR